MQCGQCRHENPDDAHFCNGCGAQLALICARCQTANSPNSRFCKGCGTPLAGTVVATSEAAGAGTAAPERERKQVTVLSCDVAESTRLTERLGPEAMHGLLERFFELALAEVHRYDGTVGFRGDGFLALFGAPRAREDHARRAVLAALGIQRRLTHQGEGPADDVVAALARTPGAFPFQVRMGLHTGLVVVGQLGDAVEAEYTAVGDTANVAARLQALAASGTILVSEATAHLVTGYVRVEAVGPLDVRGKSEPITAYRVVGMGPRRSPLEGIAPRALSRFVGRQRQLAELRDLLAQAEEGRGQAVGIAGEPGMGKSRLLYEFRRGLGDRRLTYLEGRCLSYGGAIPYLPVLDILRANCGLADSDGPDIVAARVRFALQEVGLDPDEWTPYLLHLLGIRVGTDQLATLTPEAIKSRTFDVLRQMALNGSRHRPIIFAVEDLHWIDRTSEEYLASLVEAMAGAPIFLLCTYRPRYLPPWIDHSYATQLALQRLTPRDSLSIVQSVLHTEHLPPALAQAILDRGEGNPFFLEELARAVTERSRASDTATLSLPEEVSEGVIVPDTVQGVLMARIDRLPDTPRRVLQTAAVLGREFPLRLLGAVWDGPGVLEPHLLELKRLEFIFERSDAGEPVYVFKHALTQDVAYDSLLVARRQALHAAAGWALEAQYAGRLDEVYDRLAYHYGRTEQAAKAVEYLTRLGDKAARVYANADAARALEEALTHAARLPAAERDRRVLDVALRLAHSLYFLRRVPDTLALLLAQQERLAQFDDPAVAGPYYFWLAHTYSYLSEYDRATVAAQQALREAERAGDDATAGKANYVLARIGFGACRFPEGVDFGRRAAPLLERTGEWLWLGQSHWAVGLNLVLMAQFDAALAAFRVAHDVGEAHGDPRIQTYADWASGWVLATRGDWDDGIACCRRSLECSRDSFNTAAALGWLGHALMEKGEAAQAIPPLEEGTQQLREAGYTAVTCWFLGWLAEAYRLAGQGEQAGRTAGEVLALTPGFGGAWSAAYARRVLGRLAFGQGNLAEAADAFDEALSGFLAVHSPFEAARTHLDLAALARVRGDLPVAGAHIQAALRLFRPLAVPKYLALAERLAAELPAATGVQSNTHYRQRTSRP